MSKVFKKVVASMLTIAISLTTVDLISIKAYAKETSDAIKEEQKLKETDEEIDAYIDELVDENLEEIPQDDMDYITSGQSSEDITTKTIINNAVGSLPNKSKSKSEFDVTFATLTSSNNAIFSPKTDSLK